MQDCLKEIDMVWTAFIAGVLTQASLVIAIGPQNTFVLHQGLLGQNVGIVVCFCILSDIILAFITTYGLGSVMIFSPLLMYYFQLAAIIFLLVYAGISFYRTLWPQS